MVSYIASRRGYPSWWNAEDRAAADKVNNEILPHYYKAKVAADEHLAALAKKRGSGFQGINLRPGTLSDDPATGKVWLGEFDLLLSFPLSSAGVGCCAMEDANVEQARRRVAGRSRGKMSRGWRLRC